MLQAISYVEREKQKAKEGPPKAAEGINVDSNEDLKIKECSPQEYYHILKQIGSGGYGRIYLVKRKKFDDQGNEIKEDLNDITDEQIRELDPQDLLALKYVFDCKGEEKLKSIRNEIAMMLRCSEEASIVRYEEAYIYKDKYWIFLEYMDCGCLTEIIDDYRSKIDEQFI